MILITLTPSFAQDVDHSKSNKKKLRETRLKIKTKQGDKVHKKDITGRKTKTKNRKRTAPKTIHLAPNPYSGRKEKTESKRFQPSSNPFNQPSRSTETQRKGDISGNRLKYNSKSSRERQPSNYAQPNPYAGRKRLTEDKRSKSNAPQLNSIRSISGVIGRGGGKKKKRITPRSASRPYVARSKTSANIYFGKKRKGDQAQIGRAHV